MRPSLSFFILPILLFLGSVASLFAQEDGEPKIVDGSLVFPFREPGEEREKILKKPPPVIRTLPDGFAYPVIPQEEAEDFGSYILETVQEYQLPGFAFAIVQGNTVTLEKTFGNRNLNGDSPIDNETLFNIGPVTQALTSLLAATYSTERTNACDQLARKILPDFRLNDSNSQKTINLRHLLNMTAGIPDYTDNILDPAWAQPEDVFEVMAQSPIVAQPGQTFNYSNLSVSAAGYLLAKMEDSRADIHPKFIELMQKRLLEPMGMHQATFSVSEAKDTRNYASPHKKKHNNFRPVSRWEPAINAFAPAVGLKANLKDMTRWLSTELQEGRAPDGTRVAIPLAVRERWQPTDVSKKIKSGMGWTRQIYRQTEIIANTGSYDRHTCGLGFMPRYRTGFVVLINTNSPEAAKVIQEVALGLTELIVEIKN